MDGVLNSYRTSVAADQGQIEKSSLNKTGHRVLLLKRVKSATQESKRFLPLPDTHRETTPAAASKKRHGLRSQAQIMDSAMAVRSLSFTARLGEDTQAVRTTTNLRVAAATGQIALRTRLGLSLDQFVAAEALALVLGAGEGVAFAVAVFGAAGRGDGFAPVGPDVQGAWFERVAVAAGGAPAGRKRDVGFGCGHGGGRNT